MALPKDKYTLTWKDHARNFTINLKDLLEQEELVDVTLVADGYMFRAHRLVLSALSPYFRHIFAQVPPNQQAFVFLKDISEETLEDLITFMYCGNVSVKQENLDQFFNTAKALDIKGLADRYYSNSINVETLISSTPTYSCEQFQSTRTIPVSDLANSDQYEPKEYVPATNFLYQHHDNFELEVDNQMNVHNHFENNDFIDFDDDMSNENQLPLDQDNQRNNDSMYGAKRSKPKRAKIDIDTSEYNTVADIQINGKGHQNLFMSGQKFNRHHRPNVDGQQRWQCTKQRQTKCRAAASTMDVNGSIMMKILCAEHTHG